MKRYLKFLKLIIKLRARFTADFECTTDPNDCRVWAYAISGIGHEYYTSGNSIEGFLNWCETYPKNPEVYFHNLKYDGQFIIDYLLKNGYEWIKDKKDRAERTFNTLITGLGQFFQITIYFWQGVFPKKNPRWKRVVIKDSLKLLKFKVADIAKDFNCSISKLELDYDEKREVNHILTEEEQAYIHNDVTIMSEALDFLFNEQGLTSMTIGANALSNFKKTVPQFKNLYPVIPEEVDADIRKAYRGGWCYLNPKYKEQEVGSGVVLDRNSMYPSVMYYEALPYGMPEIFEGKYEYDSWYPLYIQNFTCSFKLKPGRFPSVQLKHNLSFQQNLWLESSNNQIVTLHLANPDLKIFFENYDVDFLEYTGGYKFRAIKGVFNQYIEYWTKQKIEGKKAGNKALTLTAKLMLNSLYGKFGTNPIFSNKMPVLKDNMVKYLTLESETRDGIYIPLGVFITSYARANIITTAQSIRDITMKNGHDGFIYSDTDSCHALMNDEEFNELKTIIKIDPYELGAWDKEAEFTRGKYLRQKCYLEEIDGLPKAHIAGLPPDLAAYVNFDNFKVGFNLNDLDEEIVKDHPKLTYQTVPGGVILKSVPFEIK